MLFLLSGENKYSHCCRNSDGPPSMSFLQGCPQHLGMRRVALLADCVLFRGPRKCQASPFAQFLLLVVPDFLRCHHSFDPQWIFSQPDLTELEFHINIPHLGIGGRPRGEPRALRTERPRFELTLVLSVHSLASASPSVKWHRMYVSKGYED